MLSRRIYNNVPRLKFNKTIPVHITRTGLDSAPVALYPSGVKIAHGKLYPEQEVHT